MSPEGHPNTLQLKPSKFNLTGLDGNTGPKTGGQTFIGRRQTHSLFTYNVTIDFSPKVAEEEAGISLFLTQVNRLSPFSLFFTPLIRSIEPSCPYRRSSPPVQFHKLNISPLLSLPCDILHSRPARLLPTRPYPLAPQTAHHANPRGQHNALHVLSRSGRRLRAAPNPRIRSRQYRELGIYGDAGRGVRNEQRRERDHARLYQ